MRPHVTAVLVQWKRQRHLSKIIDSLIKYPFIDEILIRDNSKCKNIKCYARYTLAKKAKNNLIYTQDDDCIVNGIDKLYEEYLRHPDIITTGGIQSYLDVIKDNIYRYHLHGDCHMALLGWGSFFQKKWIGVLDEYVKVYGKDKCFYREPDRIFSMLLGRRHKIVLADIELLKDPDLTTALCEQPEHITFKFLSIGRALEVWKQMPEKTRLKYQ